VADLRDIIAAVLLTLAFIGALALANRHELKLEAGFVAASLLLRTCNA
jgi:hypothetical protein